MNANIPRAATGGGLASGDSEVHHTGRIDS